MPAAAPLLPTRFPCWVRATYSWGGETKRDLGFIEGDLIECLNAGDGSWWMGRLKRDKRMSGLFPSNFVQVLDESFQPGGRYGSGSPSGSISLASTPNTTQAKSTPQKTKSTFRKPFGAYHAAGSPNPAAAKREIEVKASGLSPNLSSSSGSFTKHRPFSSMKRPSKEGQIPTPIAPTNSMTHFRAISPVPPSRLSRVVHSRAPSPDRQHHHKHRSRVPSPPNPHEQYQNRARAPSPNPHSHNQHHSRAPSPNPHTMYHRAASPNPHKQYQRAASPNPHEPYQRAASPNPHTQSQRAVSPNPHMQYQRAASPNPHTQFQRAASPNPHAHYQHHSRAPSPNPPAQYQHQSRAPSPNPYQYSRAPSPAPGPQYQAYSPCPSPGPMPQYQDHSRAVSPAPSFQYQPYSRGPSPAPPVDQYSSQSPPPPAPPPHRVAYGTSRAPSPNPYGDAHHANGYHTPEPVSPAPPSRGGNYTPSPLTNAMNDVMTSLEDMAMGRQSPCPPEESASSTAVGIWSPEAFDQVYAASAKKIRAQTSLGIQAHNSFDDDDEAVFGPNSTNAPSQVSDYVQRMESRLRKMHDEEKTHVDELFMPSDTSVAPAPPPKNMDYGNRAQSSLGHQPSIGERKGSDKRRMLKHRKSAYDIGREMLGRTFTTKSSSTNASSGAQSTTTQGTTSTQMTSQSLMSGQSAGGISATSAGSLARRKWATGANRPMSSFDLRETNQSRLGDPRPETPFTGVSYHSSHASAPANEWNSSEAGGPLGGLMAPKPKKSGFFKKIIDSAKTGAATARSTISSSSISRPVSRQSIMLTKGFGSATGGNTPIASPTKDSGTSASVDWVQVRRDVNRSNSLSKNERVERVERCEMMDIPVINPIDEFYESVEGDEGLDGLPITEPSDFTSSNLGLVDKSARFVNNLPPTITVAGVAQNYICRPYRSDVQRLRAIFTWVSERIAWDDDFEGQINTRRVLQSKRGCSQEVAMLVAEMCFAIGLHAEVIRGYLKTPGEPLDFDMAARPNHYWNAVIVDGEWRIMDCSLANPTNPKRAAFSSAGTQVADTWWFLARPTEICYTHVPLLPEQQHICPPVAHEVLMALPCACPPYFRNGLQIYEYDTSLLNLDNLEMTHIHFFVPEDVECVAEVEAKTFARDADGDYFESGDIIRKRALAQPEWINGQKRYTVKGLLPGDEGHGVLKVYAGKRGLRHSIKTNPHALAFALPLRHTGQNPPFEFLTLHPTPHAQRNDLYVVSPQCARLVVNNTFVFTIRQHPSSLNPLSPSPTDGASATGRASPNPFVRPTSALSMTSISISGSNYSNQSSNASDGKQKPAKLAIQSPSGKIIRLTRRSTAGSNSGGPDGEGGTWETVIKVGESGTWRGLVLADRSARWCVFSEWECI